MKLAGVAAVVSVLGAVAVASCASHHPNAGGARAPMATPVVSSTAWRAIALPGAGADGSVRMDYLAADRVRNRVWVPAGNSGRVDVLDARDGSLTAVEGFPTKETAWRDRKVVVGPSSATVGDGVVWIGNRADQSVCAVDATSLAKGACVKLDSSPDGLAWIASAKEVWVTTPRDKSIRVLDVSNPAGPKQTARIALGGEPEGFAVDDGRGVFYTNLEDADRTLAIDVKTRALKSTWMPSCGEDGPKGLALDATLDVLVVACPDHVETLSAQGRTISTLQVGAGIDNLDYVPARRELFVAAGGAAKLVVASVGDDGSLKEKRSVATSPGARNAVASDDGAAFIADSRGGRVLMVAP